MQSVNLVSKHTVVPDRKSTAGYLKLTVCDLPLLSFQYNQRGCLFSRPPIPFPSLISLLQAALSSTLAHFPPLAGRLTTDAVGHIYITCNDVGVDFIHAMAVDIHLHDILSPPDGDVPEFVGDFFALDRTVNYDGHFRPLLAVQATELADGVFVGCTINHAIADGTSLWNFFNTFAEICKGAKSGSGQPDFSREPPLISAAVIRLPAGGPKITFSVGAPIRDRVFSFSRESVLELKSRVNKRKWIYESQSIRTTDVAEPTKMKINDNREPSNAKFPEIYENLQRIRHPTNKTMEISSFQSLCALLWQAVTRARKLPAAKTTTFQLAANCRPRIKPKLDPYYFGNAVHSIPTSAAAGDVTGRDIRWCAEQLNKSVLAYDDSGVRRLIADWERDPKCFRLGNSDGANITMGSSPRFPVYDNDFGWGRPISIRTGRANKFDGKIAAFPGKEGVGSVDLEVVLAPETMSGLESDPEFMQYVSGS